MVTGVAAVIIKERKILLVYRGPSCEDYPNTWFFPCGHSKESEKEEETAIRETKEELGIEIKVIKQIYTGTNQRTDMQEIAYLCEEQEGKIQTPKNMEPHKHGSVKYFEINHLPLNTHTKINQILKPYK